MDIWTWALAAHDRPGVPQACLDLQDAHGQNVGLLLWAAYAGAEEPALLAQGADFARAWDSAALNALRSVRGKLKATIPPVSDPAREALREQVRTVELAAERLLLETLAGLTPHRAKTPPLRALEAAVAAWGKPAPPGALAQLAAALG